MAATKLIKMSIPNAGVFVAFILALTSACLPGLGQVRQSSNILFSPGGYKIVSGDEVSIQVFGESEATTQAKINRDGLVRLVYLSGEVPILGLTTKEAEEFITKQYYDQRIYSDAKIRVNILKYSAKEVMFTGKFSKTGPFVFPPEVEAMDIVEVITRNGGFQEIAKTTEVRVTRTIHDKNGGSKKETYTVNVKEKMEGKANKSPWMIYPGDTLFVKEKLI
ncbi:MAG: polysaccharide biosynthesis/export family protein [Opitutales bacterium]|jgi:protein involved in polysaccharide export with SLBB domain